MSDRELYDKLMAGAPPGSGQAAFLAERAELLLGRPHRLNLRTRWVGARDGVGGHREAAQLHSCAHSLGAWRSVTQV